MTLSSFPSTHMILSTAPDTIGVAVVIREVLHKISIRRLTLSNVSVDSEIILPTNLISFGDQVAR